MKGLRERKKHAMWERLRSTALDLFEARGYDAVSVAEIADAAEVSKQTVFNYFPAKEDLVIGGMKANLGEPARLIAERPPGHTPHQVMREMFLGALERREPPSGLCDRPSFLTVQRLVRHTPTLYIAVADYRRRSADLIADELVAEGAPELTGRLVASHLLHTRHLLAEANVVRLLDGESAEAIHPDAVAAAHHAFDLLAHGIGDLLRRRPQDPAPGASVG